MHVCMGIDVCVHINLFDVQTCTNTLTQVYTGIKVPVAQYTYMYVHNIYTCTIYIYIYIYIYVCKNTVHNIYAFMHSCIIYAHLRKYIQV
jgi:hypothetical protein